MWVVYALLSAFFSATTDPIAKKVLSTGGDEYAIGWLNILLATPFLAILCFWNGIPAITPALIKNILVVLPFEMVAAVMYYRALKLSDISLAVPFLALTPVFAMVASFLILGEHIRPAGIAGVVLITIGVYSLNLKEAKYGFINPIKAIFLNKGSLYMAIVALIFSFTATMCKKIMLLSTPQAAPFLYNISIAIAMIPLVIYWNKTGTSSLKFKNPGGILPYIAMGFLLALSSIFYFKSISIINVPYAISIKRLSLLMSVGYGWLFFREHDIKLRFASTFCMFAGVVLILVTR